MSDPTGMTTSGPQQLHPIDKLLVCMIVIFVLMMVGISKWSPSDGQTFQALFGLASSAMAAFLARITPNTTKKPDDRPEEPKA